MDRKKWSHWIAEKEWPAWTCPTCGVGTFQVDESSIKEEETAESRRKHRREHWDPSDITNRFTAWLKCSKVSCSEIGVITGTSGPDGSATPDGEWFWEQLYLPHILEPMPDIIAIPPKCPERPANELRASFRLYWVDPSAAANRLRIALEDLLDVVGVKRRRRIPGAIHQMSLHQRIEVFGKREPVIAAQLMAVKWLGNTASHESEISQEALLDAFEIIEHVLEEIVGERSKRMAELARKLTDQHAPKKRRAPVKTRGPKK